jgi:hypothetical protein
MFCLPQYIEPSAIEIFQQLRSEDFLPGLDRDTFIDRLTYYLGEVNAVHLSVRATAGLGAPSSSSLPTMRGSRWPGSASTQNATSPPRQRWSERTDR